MNLNYSSVLRVFILSSYFYAFQFHEFLAIFINCNYILEFYFEPFFTYTLSAIQSKYSDWKDFLVKRLTGARTLPSNFYMKVMESVSSIFRPNMKLELVDKMRICQVRVTTIKEITGRRLYLQYDETEHEDNVFWCHEESPLIHPIGKRNMP